MGASVNTNVNDPTKSFAGPGDTNKNAISNQPEEFPPEPAENDLSEDLSEHDIVSEEMRNSTHRF